MIFFFNVDLIDIGILRDDFSVENVMSKSQNGFCSSESLPPLTKSHTLIGWADADGVSHSRRTVCSGLTHAPNY